MRTTLSAKLPRFIERIIGFAIILVICLSAGLSAGSGHDYNNIPVAPSQDILDRVKDAVSKFKEAIPEEEIGDLREEEILGVSRDDYRRQGDKENDVGVGSQRHEEPQTASDDIPLSHPEDTAENTEDTSEDDDEDQETNRDAAVPASPKRILFFFSFSMPPDSLSRSLLEVMELRRQGHNAVMVIRGFVQNDLKATMAAYNRLIKDADVQGKDLPINIDPPLFRKYDVNTVPVMIAEYEDIAGRVIGDVGLPYFLSKMEEEIGDHGKLGHTYPITEESFLDLIARKQPEIERKLKQRIEVKKKEMYVLKKHDGRYEKAREDRTYYIDPTWVAPEDVLDHEGKVVIPKGSRHNPAEYVQLGSHIIIDGNDPAQVRMALSGGYRTMMIISGDLSKLITKHRKRFWFAPDEVLDKFRIRRVPAIIEQEGKLVRITEKKPD